MVLSGEGCGHRLQSCGVWVLCWADCLPTQERGGERAAARVLWKRAQKGWALLRGKICSALWVGVKKTGRFSFQRKVAVRYVAATRHFLMVLEAMKEGIQAQGLSQAAAGYP